VPDVGVVHRRLDDGDFYFVANTGAAPRELTFDQPMEVWNPRSENISVRRSTTLHPYESAVLVPATTAVDTGAPADQLVSTLDGEWTVAFDNDVRPVELPHRWEDDRERATYSGSATYRTTFEVPDTGDRLALDFGAGSLVAPDSEPYLPGNSYRALINPPVGVAADVWLNDTHCGSLWAPPYRIDLSGAVRPGVNELRVVVHNTAANALSVDQHLLDAAAEVTAQNGRRFDLQHIEHAIDYVYSGLLAVPTFVRQA
jgi:hypothetical protein